MKGLQLNPKVKSIRQFKKFIIQTHDFCKIKIQTYSIISISMSQQNLQQFMLRKERHRKMIESRLMPTSTPDRFIVPCFQRSFGFRTNEFAKNSQKLEDYIDRITFERFIRKINNSIDKALLEKAKNQSSPFFCWTSFYLKISIFLGILTFTILSLIVYLEFSPQNEQKILNASIVLIIFSVVIASLCPVYLYLKKYKEYDYESIIKDQLDHIADQQNAKNVTEGREYLRWKIQKSFFWIELEINHKLFQEKSRRLVHRFGNETPPLIQ